VILFSAISFFLRLLFEETLRIHRLRYVEEKKRVFAATTPAFIDGYTNVNAHLPAGTHSSRSQAATLTPRRPPDSLVCS
jgi:hypothetical protein